MAYLITIYLVFLIYSWYSKYQETNSKEAVITLVKRDVKFFILVVVIFGIFKLVQMEDSDGGSMINFDSSNLYQEVKPYLIWVLIPIVVILFLVNNKIKK
jgi:membrane protease YdiL (CAAX protease family)